MSSKYGTDVLALPGLSLATLVVESVDSMTFDTEEAALESFSAPAVVSSNLSSG